MTSLQWTLDPGPSGLTSPQWTLDPGPRGLDIPAVDPVEPTCILMATSSCTSFFSTSDIRLLDPNFLNQQRDHHSERRSQGGWVSCQNRKDYFTPPSPKKNTPTCFQPSVHFSLGGGVVRAPHDQHVDTPAWTPLKSAPRQTLDPSSCSEGSFSLKQFSHWVTRDRFLDVGVKIDHCTQWRNYLRQPKKKRPRVTQCENHLSQDLICPSTPWWQAFF